jgi:hypothetical protein
MAVVVGLRRRVERHKENVELWPKKWPKVDLCHAMQRRSCLGAILDGSG